MSAASQIPLWTGGGKMAQGVALFFFCSERMEHLFECETLGAAVGKAAMPGCDNAQKDKISKMKANRK